MKNSSIKLLFMLLLTITYSCKTNNNDQENRLESKNELKTVTLASYFNAVDYAPFIVAKNKGWFDEILEDDGVTVKYKTFEDLAVINDAFLNGELDVVFEAGPPAIVSEAAGVGIDVLNISCSLVQEVLVGTDSDVENIQGLKGKNIAVFSGTSSHYGVLRLLNNVGVKETEVKIIDLAPIDAKVAFETGKVDAWAVWPPFVEQQELNGKGRVLPKGDVFIHSIIAVREGLINDYPEIYSQINETIDKTKNWIIENPEESITIVAKAMNMDRAIVEKAWPRHDWSVKLNSTIVQDFQNKADFLKSENKIQSSLNVPQKLIPQKVLQ